MVKVAVLGASGGVGQPLSLLLKTSPHISRLSLYDVQDPSGISTDLSHINTNSDITPYNKNELHGALSGAHIVVIPAGMARKPGMTRDDLFKINAKIVRMLCMNVAEICPKARVLIISNPVNSLVPVAVETFKELKCFDARNVMGVTMLDLVRSETFLGDYLNGIKTGSKSKQYDKSKMGSKISVVGGHSGTTIVPVMLDKAICYTLGKKYDELIHRVQFGGDEVIKAKKGTGSATLSMAYAGFTFVEEILKSIHRENSNGVGYSRRYIPAYVYLPDLHNGVQLQLRLEQITKVKDIKYFSIPINFKNGYVDEIDVSILDNLSEKENELLKVSATTLVTNIEAGERYVTSNANAKL